MGCRDYTVEGWRGIVEAGNGGVGNFWTIGRCVGRRLWVREGTRFFVWVGVRVFGTGLWEMRGCWGGVGMHGGSVYAGVVGVWEFRTGVGRGE